MDYLSKTEFSETLKNYGWIFTGDKQNNFHVWTKAFKKSIAVISLVGDDDNATSIMLDVSNNEGETLIKMEIDREDISKIRITDNKFEIYKINPVVSIGDLE